MNEFYGEEQVSSPGKQRHAAYPLLCGSEWEHHWAHCAICGSRNDGHFSDGSPRYSGGHVLVETKEGPYVTACACAAGKHFSDSGLIRFDAMPKGTKYLTAPMLILWVRGESEGKPPAPMHLPNVAEYRKRMCKGMGWKMQDKIKQKEWLKAAKILEERLMPAKYKCPTLAHVLNSPELRLEYIRDWSALPASAPTQNLHPQQGGH